LDWQDLEGQPVTGEIKTEDTIEKYKDYLGGTGVAYKVLWDEVPAGTMLSTPGNKIIFGVGPLTAPRAAGDYVRDLPTAYPVQHG